MNSAPATHFIIVRKSDGGMISGYFNRRWNDRTEPEAIIAADRRTGDLFQVVEVTTSDLAAKTYTPAI